MKMRICDITFLKWRVYFNKILPACVRRRPLDNKYDRKNER